MNREQAFELCVAKTRNNLKSMQGHLREYPGRSDGQYFSGDQSKALPLGHIFGWTHSFFTGMAYWSFRATREESFLRWMNQFSEEYRHKVFDTPMETMHDLGFLYSPYAVALFQHTNDLGMKAIALRAAEVLAMRFEPRGGYLRAWGRMDNQIPGYVSSELAKDHFFTESRGLAIIDCMMNLPLLFWASETTGHSFFRQIATVHADTTLKYFLRSDGSVCHAFRFHEETGQPLGPANYCGFATDSFWARGTAWAIYGFALAWSYTQKNEYLEAAQKLSQRFVDECEPDGIPLWDFRLPSATPALYCGSPKSWIDWDIQDPENIKFNRDTSAAAIALCGMALVLKELPDSALQAYCDKAQQSLIEVYMDRDPATPGILTHQNGMRISSCIGDYFFMELLASQLFGFAKVW